MPGLFLPRLPIFFLPFPLVAFARKLGEAAVCVNASQEHHVPPPGDRGRGYSLMRLLSALLLKTTNTCAIAMKESGTEREYNEK